MTDLTPKTVTRHTEEVEELEALDAAPIPWDELSEGSRQYLEDIRAGLRQARAGETIDADESLRQIRQELGLDEK